MKQRSFIVLLLLMGGLFFFPRGSQADIQLDFESPADDQTISGLSPISGWAFSTDPEASVTVRLRIDDGDASVIPCCAGRTDIAAENSDFPQAATSGFGQVFNFNSLEQGEHTFTIEVEDTSGTRVTQAHTITTVKPGDFEVLERLDLQFAGIKIRRDDILIDGAGAIDSVTGNAQEVDIRLAWQEKLQALGIVSSENTGAVTTQQTSRVTSKIQRAEPVNTQEQVNQAATGQLPAVIRVDPNTGNRTIVSDANTTIPAEDGTDTLVGSDWVVPQGVTVKADGQLAVTDPGRFSVYRVDPDTGERTFVSGTSSLSGPALIRPTGIAVAPLNSESDGVLIVADSGLKGVVEISSTGYRFILSDFKIEGAVNLESPFGIAIEASGTAVVTDLGLKALVRVMLDETEERAIFSDASTGSGVNWMTPLDIDVEDSGDLLVVDAGLNAVVRVNPTNGNRTVVSNATNGTGPAFQQARALAIEANGQLAVLDEGLRAIFRVDPTSGNRTILSDASIGSGAEFRVPTDIAVEADGNLIVIETAPLLAALENPLGDSVGGFGMISGWRFSNAPDAEITDLQLQIDGVPSSFDLLCCIDREDVADKFPERRSQALPSGFSTPINFNLLESGQHTFDITIQDSLGASQTLSSSLDTVRLGSFEFVEEFDLSDAEVRLANQILFVDDLSVQGRGSDGNLESREIDTSFVWQASCQCFVASSECGNGSLESSEECDGADLGDLTCQEIGFSGGTLGCRVDCSLDFKECEGGPAVLVTNSGDDTVSLLSAATHAVAKTIPVGNNPRSVAVKPASQVAYVTNAWDDSISVMSLNTLMPELTVVTNTIENVGDTPVGLAFTPDGTKAYVANGGEDTVGVIDTATETLDSPVIPVGSNPLEIAINAAGTYAYVTNFDDDTVSVIDLGTNTVTDTVTVGNGPNGIAVRPDGTEVYVVNLEDDTVSIIDTRTNEVSKTLTRKPEEGNIEIRPQQVIFSPDGARAYISNSLDFTVTVIDTATRNSINSLFVGAQSFNDVINEPNGLFISLNGRRLYVALFGRNGQGRYLGVFSTATNRIQAFTEIGNGPISVTVGGS